MEGPQNTKQVRSVYVHFGPRRCKHSLFLELFPGYEGRKGSLAALSRYAETIKLSSTKLAVHVCACYSLRNNLIYKVDYVVALGYLTYKGGHTTAQTHIRATIYEI